ncbi:hypothetical protein L1987_78585 [Smallanthus sonchifolius]|uniref:Uncharacterized protein n=1 Tax=Smallanthus sonchifolius TaxID=185202 RepID=A0ACB8ZC50_9ASTR|nr:hypothetical protein L1987_78585 [Smallanthus sonchifolius]
MLPPPRKFHLSLLHFLHTTTWAPPYKPSTICPSSKPAYPNLCSTTYLPVSPPSAGGDLPVLRLIYPSPYPSLSSYLPLHFNLKK